MAAINQTNEKKTPRKKVRESTLNDIDNGNEKYWNIPSSILPLLIAGYMLKTSRKKIPVIPIQIASLKGNSFAGKKNRARPATIGTNMIIAGNKVWTTSYST